MQELVFPSWEHVNFFPLSVVLLSYDSRLTLIRLDYKKIWTGTGISKLTQATSPVVLVIVVVAVVSWRMLISQFSERNRKNRDNFSGLQVFQLQFNIYFCNRMFSWQCFCCRSVNKVLIHIIVYIHSFTRPLHEKTFLFLLFTYLVPPEQLIATAGYNVLPALTVETSLAS